MDVQRRSARIEEGQDTVAVGCLSTPSLNRLRQAGKYQSPSSSRFPPPASSLSPQDLQCTICRCILDRPVVFPCQKFVCAEYVVQRIRRTDAPVVTCSCCDGMHEISSFVSPAPEVILKVLGSLLIKCDRTQCSEVVALKNLRTHMEAGCQGTAATYSPSKLTVAQLLSRFLTSPLTTMERMMTASASSGDVPSEPSGSRLLKLACLLRPLGTAFCSSFYDVCVGCACVHEGGKGQQTKTLHSLSHAPVRLTQIYI